MVYVNTSVINKSYFYNNQLLKVKDGKIFKDVYLDLTLGRCRKFWEIYDRKKHLTIFNIIEYIIKTDKESLIEQGFNIWDGFFELYNLFLPFYEKLAFSTFSYDQFDYYKMRNIFSKEDLIKFYLQYCKIMESLKMHPYYYYNYKNDYKGEIYIPSFICLDLLNVFHLSNTLYFFMSNSFLYYNLEFKHDYKIRDIKAGEDKINIYYKNFINSEETLICHKAYGILFISQFSFDNLQNTQNFHNKYYIYYRFPGINSLLKNVKSRSYQR